MSSSLLVRQITLLSVAMAISVAQAGEPAAAPTPSAEAETLKKTCKLGTDLAWAIFKQEFEELAPDYVKAMKEMSAKIRTISANDWKSIASGHANLVKEKLHLSTANFPYLGKPTCSCSFADVTKKGTQMVLLTYKQAKGINPKAETGGYSCLIDFREAMPRVDEDVTFLYFDSAGQLIYDKYVKNQQSIRLALPLAATPEEQAEGLKKLVREQLPSWKSTFEKKLDKSCPFEDMTQSRLGQLGLLPPKPAATQGASKAVQAPSPPAKTESKATGAR
jgi:hypothetical protein